MILAVWNYLIGASPLIMLGMLKDNLSANRKRLHRRLLTYALFKIDENYVGKDLEAVPTPIDDDLGAIPQLTAVAHPWLRQFELVHFGLEPVVLLSVEDENVVHDPLLTVTFPAPENDQKLAELGT